MTTRRVCDEHGSEIEPRNVCRYLDHNGLNRWHTPDPLDQRTVTIPPWSSATITRTPLGGTIITYHEGPTR